MGKQGKERLTIEDVRKHLGFEGRTDEEINAVIDVVEKLALLIYRRIKRTHNLNPEHDQESDPP